jgi:hypothetical protein
MGQRLQARLESLLAKVSILLGTIVNRHLQRIPSLKLQSGQFVNDAQKYE